MKLQLGVLRSHDSLYVTDINVSVSWSGGGDIMPKETPKWDITSLMRVAMEFPDKVARCEWYTWLDSSRLISLHQAHSEQGQFKRHRLPRFGTAN